MTKKAGVVLVNYHSDKQVISIATQFSQYSCIDKIVIINNDCSNELYTNSFRNKKILKNLNEKIVIKNVRKNIGYSRGNNLGMKILLQENCEYFIIANSDIEIDEDTIYALLEKLSENKDYGVLAPEMLDANRKLTELRYIPLDYRRVFLRLFRGIDKNSRSKIEVENGIYRQSFVPGSFFVASREAMETINYLDSNVFMYREEEILGKRMENAGYKVGVVAGLEYVHKHRYDLMSVKDYFHMYKREFISERYYLKKYLGASKLHIILIGFFQFIFGFSRSVVYGFIKKK